MSRFHSNNQLNDPLNGWCMRMHVMKPLLFNNVQTNVCSLSKKILLKMCAKILAKQVSPWTLWFTFSKYAKSARTETSVPYFLHNLFSYQTRCLSKIKKKDSSIFYEFLISLTYAKLLFYLRRKNVMSCMFCMLHRVLLNYIYNSQVIQG